jgi:EAL domain-containing protein (putative c-di-GMP-specific phosphodiesterase class I)
LTLEVTETVAVKHIDIVGRSIAILQKVGVRISLDDFGTGLSSLAAVLHLPVNELKIDRSFVAALDACPRARALVKGTITTAQELDLMVVAEGVERADQRRTLWELGCGAGQGSLFGWPAQPTDELIATLHRGHDGTPGTVAEQLNPDATVLRLPRQNRGVGCSGQQV